MLSQDWAVIPGFAVPFHAGWGSKRNIEIKNSFLPDRIRERMASVPVLPAGFRGTEKISGRFGLELAAGTLDPVDRRAVPIADQH